MLQIEERYMNIQRSWARGQIASRRCTASVCFSLFALEDAPLHTKGSPCPQKLHVEGWEQIKKRPTFMENLNAIYSEPLDPVRDLIGRQSAGEGVAGRRVTFGWVPNKAFCCLRIFTTRPQMSLQVTLTAQQTIPPLKIQGNVNLCAFSS